jgi:ATP-dependent RNA helicase DDX55/SPB4
LLERGSRAFMAHLRAYKDHRCEFIFRFNQLDLGGLANALALLRLPKIPELSGRGAPRVRGFAPDFTFKTEAVPYLDKSREKARLKRLAVSKEAAAAAEQLEAAAHAAAGPHAFKQLSGAAKKQAANLAEAQKQNPKWTAEGPRKRKGKRATIQEEWDDLAKEERLYKKLKKGKLTQKQYEAALKGQDAGGSEGESGGEEADGCEDESD